MREPLWVLKGWECIMPTMVIPAIKASVTLLTFEKRRSPPLSAQRARASQPRIGLMPARAIRSGLDSRGGGGD
jgi:hypothetical protein